MAITTMAEPIMSSPPPEGSVDAQSAHGRGVTGPLDGAKVF